MDGKNSRFKVIAGGKDCTVSFARSQPDLTAKRQKLNAIERTIILRRNSRMGPRASNAYFVAFWVAIGIAGAIIGLGKLGLFRLPINSATFAETVCAGAFAAFLVGYFYSKRPKTWTTRLEQQLASYEPLDRDAFQRLQLQTMELGYLEKGCVYEWLGAERHAIEVAAG